MPLTAASRRANIQLSLDHYLSNTLTSGGSLTLHKHGVRQFVPPSNAAWVAVQYDLLDQSRQFYRQTNTSIVGTEVTGTVLLTIAQHSRAWTDRHTLASARDTVVGYVPESGLIRVYDYASTVSATQVGAVLIDGLGESWLDTGRDTGLVQYQVRVQVRFLEETTAPA